MTDDDDLNMTQKQTDAARVEPIVSPPFSMGDWVKRIAPSIGVNPAINGTSRVFVGSTHRVAFVLYENDEWYLGLEGITAGYPQWLASNFEPVD